MSITAGAVPPAMRPGTCGVVSFVAAGKLTAFSWLADNAAHAPNLMAREALARAAADQMAHYDDVAALLGELAPDPTQRVAPFLTLLEEMGERTTPADWWEQLMRSVVVGGMVRDLDVVLAGSLAPPLAARTQRGMNDPADLIAGLLVRALADDAPLRARLALWGRRIAGEALGVLPLVLAALRAEAAREGGLDDGSATAVAQLHTPAMTAMSGGHARRMDRLDLTA